MHIPSCIHLSSSLTFWGAARRFLSSILHSLCWAGSILIIVVHPNLQAEPCLFFVLFVLNHLPLSNSHEPHELRDLLF